MHAPGTHPSFHAQGVCCFDKTGTLTSEDLVLEGVAGAAPGDREETGIEGKGDDAHWPLVKGGEPALPADTVHVLVGCHGLVHIDDVVIGETMERVALQALGGDSACVFALSRVPCTAVCKHKRARLSRRVVSGPQRRRFGPEWPTPYPGAEAFCLCFVTGSYVYYRRSKGTGWYAHDGAIQGRPRGHG